MNIIKLNNIDTKKNNKPIIKIPQYTGNTIHLDLSSIKDANQFNEELRSFDIPERNIIKDFFFKLNNLNMTNLTYKNDSIICSDKYAFITIKDIFYSYIDFHMHIEFSIRSNYIKYKKNKKIEDELLTELFEEYEICKLFGSLITTIFKNNSYSLSSSRKSRESKPETNIGDRYIEVNDGDIYILFEEYDTGELEFIGCCIPGRKFIEFSICENTAIFINRVGSIYKDYISDKSNTNSTTL